MSIDRSIPTDQIASLALADMSLQSATELELDQELRSFGIDPDQLLSDVLNQFCGKLREVSLELEAMKADMLRTIRLMKICERSLAYPTERNQVSAWLASHPKAPAEKQPEEIV